MNDAPEWGAPPVPDVVARLLAERWSIEPPEAVTVDVDEKAGAISARLDAGRSAFRLELTYRSGGEPGADPWMLLVDALDALFGQLEERGRAHRELPSGEGVSFGDALFLVVVERSVPELAKLADKLLGEAPESLD